jgi:urease accessory protein
VFKRLAATALILGATVAPALAHLDPAEHGSFMAGVSHPLFGLDHILAMVAVGLWAALLVEPVIAASVVVIGLLALVALQVPAVVGMVMVGFFAFFHGYAHGGELGEAGAPAFCAGFAISTALLHALGVGVGFGMGGSAGRWVTRIAGGLTALGGLWLVAGT